MAIVWGAPLAGASAMGPASAPDGASEVTALTGLFAELHAARIAAAKRAITGATNRKDMTCSVASHGAQIVNTKRLCEGGTVAPSPGGCRTPHQECPRKSCIWLTVRFASLDKR